MSTTNTFERTLVGLSGRIIRATFGIVIRIIRRFAIVILAVPVLTAAMHGGTWAGPAWIAVALFLGRRAGHDWMRVIPAALQHAFKGRQIGLWAGIGLLTGFALAFAPGPVFATVATTLSFVAGVVFARCAVVSARSIARPDAADHHVEEG